MDKKIFSDVPVLREPVDGSRNPLQKFTSYISEKYKVQIDNYWDLHRWSCENFRSFWEEIWDLANIVCSRRFDEVFPANGKVQDTSLWFRGARLNYAENLLKFRDEHLALIVSGENKKSRKITYSEVYNEACRYGAALRSIGVKKGDRVICYISNREEAIYAMLGVTSLGAVLSCASPLLGSQAVLNRFKQLEAKVLFTTDETQYDKKKIELLEKVKEIAAGLPSLKKVVIVPSTADSRNKDISEIRNGCFLDEFLTSGLNADGSVPELEFEQLPFDHPVFISFTSGTTGLPKALVHGAGVLMLVTREFCIRSGTRDSVGICISPPGWSSWNLIFTSLSHGTTTLVYEGLPYFVSPTHIWDLVDEFGLSSLFLTPTILDDLEKLEYLPNEKHKLTSLKMIMSTGSVMKPVNYDFICKKLKLNVPFGSFYVSTELMGVCLTMESSLPIYKGEISCPALGIETYCYNDEGKPVVGEIGQLVVVTPVPSLPLCLWGEDGGRNKLIETYFSTFPGIFTPGDTCIINPITKGYIICGRSDETLKPKGTRFGSSEIYNVVDKFPEVQDSICVSQYNKNGDERAVLFLKMRPGQNFDQNLVRKIRLAVANNLSEGHVPEVILEAKDIPRNANGKKMEITVKKIINGMPYNPEVVINSDCLTYYSDIKELQGF